MQTTYITTSKDLTPQKVDELLEFLNECSDEYYKNHTSLISDEEYDRLINLLENYKVTGNNVVTQVGSDLTSSNNVTHTVPMLSLKNTYTIFEVKDFWDKTKEEVSCQPKLDGISISLEYNLGKLIKGSTRGNGTIGDDITPACLNLINVPATIEYKNKIEIRGEAVIAINNFNKNYSDEYSNPRNFVSGTMKSKNPIAVKNRGIEFIGYYLISDSINHSKYSEDLTFIKKLGITVIDNELFSDKTLIEDYIVNKKAPMFTKYPTDGVVIKIDNTKVYSEIGETSKYPKWAIAYKYPANRKKSVVSAIDWQISRNGILTPVAVLKDILDFDGVEVTRCTLHNAKFVNDMNIYVGSSLTIERSGEVIPHVVSVSNDISIVKITPFPLICPICSTMTKWDGVNIVCTNPGCNGRLTELLYYFTSKIVLDINGFGYSTIKKLMNSRTIPFKEIGDIFKLKDNKIELIKLFGEKTAVKLLDNIEESKNKPAYITLRAMNIPNIGTSMSKVLLNKFGSIDAVITAKKEELMNIEGIGEIVADSIINIPTESINIYNSCTLYLNTAQIIKKDSIKFKSIVVTGTFENFSPRKKLIDKLNDLGIKSASSVTKNTSYLILGEKGSQSKVNKAKKLEIPIYNEDYVIKNILK